MALILALLRCLHHSDGMGVGVGAGATGALKFVDVGLNTTLRGLGRMSSMTTCSCVLSSTFGTSVLGAINAKGTTNNADSILPRLFANVDAAPVSGVAIVLHATGPLHLKVDDRPLGRSSSLLDLLPGRNPEEAPIPIFRVWEPLMFTRK